MLKSMTGYGKAECVIAGDKYLFEIRSVNGRNADITLKTSVIPREREVEVRQYIASVLNRGNIDLFANVEHVGSAGGKTVNKEIVSQYIRQISAIAGENRLEMNDSLLMLMALRMPDVTDASRQQELPDEEWETMFRTIKTAVAGLDAFRVREGSSLKKDVLGQVDKIESYVCEVEKYEKERIDSVREKILARFEELALAPDKDRIEQEMIFYIEKLDINEEKVRLRQHCRYFRETIEKEENPGRKLGFIAQEMGREINTMGSKANHSEIQKWVVRMKDELEKIKEQSLNIL